MKNTFFEPHNARRMGKILMVLGLVLVLFVGMLFVNEAEKMNAPTDISNVATINVTGTGTAFAIPDVATESFTVENTADTIADAQSAVTASANAAIAFLKSSGVADADIQTTDYSANPQYSYPTPCVPGRLCTETATAPTLTGYDVSESVTVKIRDTSKVGAIVAGLGQEGVTGLSGPNFTVDDPDAVNAQAQSLAIANAQQKAEVLAKQLGVSLVRVVGFSDNGSNAPSPMLYSTAMAPGATAAAAPEIAPGQNKYVSNVTVTYEIQ